MKTSILQPQLMTTALSNTLWLRPVLSIAGAIIYYYLFYQSTLFGLTGLNVLLFDIILLSFSYLLDKTHWQREFVRFSGLGLLILGGAVLLINSGLARVVHNLYLLSFLAYIQRRELRFIGFAILLGLWSISSSWVRSIRSLPIFNHRGWLGHLRFRNLWLVILPIGLLIPFYFLYFEANPAFATFFEWFYNLFIYFPELNLIQIIYLLFGFALLTAALYPAEGHPFLVNWQKNWAFQLLRKRSKGPSFWHIEHKTLGLKYEYRIASVSFAALNLLLLIANLADLRFLWLSFGDKTPTQLSQYVHAGTWALIASIILAMIVVLIFFRKNLNFYPHSNSLRQLAYIWLAQNVWLALGVGLRNGYYIHYYGLADGRILVVIFLVLVFIGLWTMYLKIKGKKTLYFVLQSNALSVMLTLLVVACINWDVMITRYNLWANTRNGFDAYYHIQSYNSSYQNTFLLLKKEEKILKKASNLGAEELRDILYRRANYFIRQKEDWRRWNWADARNKRAASFWLAEHYPQIE